MTLVMAMGNADYFLMMADRRLTAVGSVTEEDAGKLCLFVLGDSKVAVAFTGLARTITGFDTRRWLLDALSESAEPDFRLMQTIGRFADRASRDFGTLPALRSMNPLDKRIEFLFGGYGRGADRSRLVAGLVSNFRDGTTRKIASSRPEFSFWIKTEPQPPANEPVLLTWIGAEAITTSDLKPVEGLLRQRRPHHAVLGKATEIIIAAADRRKAYGTVGKRFSWLRIPADLRKGVESGYYSDKPSYESYMPDMIVRTPRGGGSAAFMSFKVTSRDEPPITSIPNVAPRAPCPCKSGKRYKNCCGSRARSKQLPNRRLKAKRP